MNPDFSVIKNLLDRAESDDQASRQLGALLHAAWLVFAADEFLDDHEAASLVSLIRGLTDDEVSEDFLAELLDTYADMHDSLGLDGSADAIADALPEPPLREAAFRLAATVAHRRASAHAPHDERALAALARAFAFSPDRIRALSGGRTA